MIKRSNTSSSNQVRARRRATAALHIAFLALFVAAGSVCAITATVIEAIVFAEQFKKPTPWGSLVPLVVAVAISLEVAKVFFHYYCSSSAIVDDSQERWNRIFYNPLRILLTLISLAAATVFCCWQLQNANFGAEAKTAATRIAAEEKAATDAVTAESQTKVAAQEKADEADVNYWQGLFNEQQKIRGWNGTWIGPQAKEIDPKLTAAKQARDQHRNDILKEQTKRLHDVRAEFSARLEKELDELRVSRQSDSPIIGAVLALFRPDYPHNYYTTFVIAQGGLLSIAMEGVIMAAFMVLGGFERRRGLSRQIADDFDSLEEVVQSFGDRMENEIASKLSRQFGDMTSDGENSTTQGEPRNDNGQTSFRQ